MPAPSCTCCAPATDTTVEEVTLHPVAAGAPPIGDVHERVQPSKTESGPSPPEVFEKRAPNAEAEPQPQPEAAAASGAAEAVKEQQVELDQKIEEPPEPVKLQDTPAAPAPAPDPNGAPAPESAKSAESAESTQASGPASADSIKVPKDVIADAAETAVESFGVQYYKELYMFLSKIIGFNVAALLLWSGPFVLATWFTKPLDHTAVDFAAACEQDPNTDLQNFDIVYWISCFKNLIFEVVSFVGSAVFVKIELYEPSGDAEEVAAVQSVRKFWSVPAGICSLIRGAGLFWSYRDYKIQETAYNFYVLLTLIQFVLFSIAFHRQGMKVKQPWYNSTTKLTLAILYMSVVCVVVAGAGGFGDTFLLEYKSTGQLIFIGVMNGAQALTKFVFRFLGTHEAFYVFISWILTIAFMLQIRIYTFVQPTLASLSVACLMNVGTQVAGQVGNMVIFKFIVKHPTERVIKFQNAQLVHELIKSHVCNIIAVYLLVAHNPRYWAITPTVAMDTELDYGLILTGFVVMTIFELLHDVVMFVCLRIGQPFVNLVAMIRTPGVGIVWPILSAVNASGACISYVGMRYACFVCGIEIPHARSGCFDEVHLSMD